MSDQVLLKAEPRDDVGTGSSRQLRREGYVPGVVYGHGREAAAVKISAHELDMLLGSISASSTVIGLQVGSRKPNRVLIREIQRHPFRADILHVDFFQIREDEKIRVLVPLRLQGTPAGVEAGGVIQQNRHELTVESLPGDLPEAIELDVSGLEVGDSFHVSDIEAGEITIVDDLDITVCTVLPPTVLKVVEEEEEELAELEELEPEVIGRGKAEDEEGEADESASEGES
jgi:large subunit ribosomal protein L25